MDDDKDSSIIEQVGRDTGVTGHFRAWVKKADAPVLHQTYETVERLVEAAVAAVMDNKPDNVPKTRDNFVRMHGPTHAKHMRRVRIHAHPMGLPEFCQRFAYLRLRLTDKVLIKYIGSYTRPHGQQRPTQVT